MITSASLCFSYSPGQNVLHDLQFSLDSGLILGLAGANGAGKSTLLYLLAGLLRPTSGILRVLGQDSAVQAAHIRRLAALVPQEADLSIIGATIEDDLCLGMPREAHAEALSLARRLGLPALDTPVHLLSHGQKRKLCLAAALLRKPQLLLLDEPFAGLDYPGCREMRAMLRTNRLHGVAQVVAVHDLEPLADLADRWLVLDHGCQAVFGTAADAFPKLEQLNVRAPCSWQAGLGILPWDDLRRAWSGS
ncbi:MAG TPA: ABC transporter ATP-binding protein [Desulfonatronum sp.]|nr:ABC transporter ATP-binding protein [Desulfonatronum sp.]